jgi:acetyltransferase-like isoleucine patch superfamily enzyme
MGVILTILRLPARLLRRLGIRVATLWYRRWLAACGAGTLMQWGVQIDAPQRVQIGAGCYLWRGVSVSAELGQAGLHLGDQVQINRDVHLDITGGLRIGAGSLISESVLIYTHDHGSDPRNPAIPRPKVIGRDVWIGARAVILPQCARIGDHARIGAGAIVTRDVPQGAIVAGNPAKIIGYQQRTKAA